MVKVKDALFVILIHYPDLEPNRNQKIFRYGKGYTFHKDILIEHKYHIGHAWLFSFLLYSVFQKSKGL